LQKFGSGALVFDGEQMRLLANPFVHPGKIWQGLFSDAVGLRDKALVLKLVGFVHQWRIDGKIQPQSTLEFLRSFGFSERFLNFFWRPFLGGVLLDTNLNADVSYVLFLLQCFGLGTVSVPAGGMAKLPEAIAAPLDPRTIRLNTRVVEVKPHSVRLASGESLDASFVVKASAERENRTWCGVTTYSFATTEKLDWGKWLVLVPTHLNLTINHCALMSSVARTYSPSGETLISASVLGPEAASPKVVASDLEKLAGRSLQLRLLQVDHVPLAFPTFQPGQTGFVWEDGVLVCGDHVSSPSINGALRSGRLAAEELMRQFKIRSEAPIVR